MLKYNAFTPISLKLLQKENRLISETVSVF